jgi:hypothetical protein
VYEVIEAKPEIRIEEKPAKSGGLFGGVLSDDDNSSLSNNSDMRPDLN